MKIIQFKSAEATKACVEMYNHAFKRIPFQEIWKPEQTARRLADFYTKNPDLCYSAVEDGKILGFIFCGVQIWNDGDHLFIEDCVVHPYHQGKGIGTSLVATVEQVAKEKGLVASELSSHTSSRGEYFWRKADYKPTGLHTLTKKL